MRKSVKKEIAAGDIASQLQLKFLECYNLFTGSQASTYFLKQKVSLAQPEHFFFFFMWVGRPLFFLLCVGGEIFLCVCAVVGGEIFPHPHTKKQKVINIHYFAPQSNCTGKGNPVLCLAIQIQRNFEFALLILINEYHETRKRPGDVSEDWKVDTGISFPLVVRCCSCLDKSDFAHELSESHSELFRDHNIWPNFLCIMPLVENINFPPMQEGVTGGESIYYL